VAPRYAAFGCIRKEHFARVRAGENRLAARGQNLYGSNGGYVSAELVQGQLTYPQRIDALRTTKQEQTAEKQELLGSMDHDDWAQILPPLDQRRIVEARSASGMLITDCALEGFEIESNHPSGGFFGPRACGKNFRALLESHPTYVDPMSSLAGGYMVNFSTYRQPHWNPDFDPALLKPHLVEARKKYKLLPGIGAMQHFCQDLHIGLELGWGGIQHKIRRYRLANAPHGADFYHGLEEVVLGIQNLIQRHATAARRMAEEEVRWQLKTNLHEIATINERLVAEPPKGFREACQWILWYQMVARMYNGSGSLGQLDKLLQPFFQQDMARGCLTEEEATFHIACLLLRDTAYLQLGGLDRDGRDCTNRVSFLILEAAHLLKIPANIGICVGDGVDSALLRRGVELLLEDRTGIPKFLGIDRTTEGFTRGGFPVELGRQRTYSGCQWSALPGREYSLNDCIKINFTALFDCALREMMADPQAQPGVEELWKRFVVHMRQAVRAVAEGLDFHVELMHEVFPELVLDLCSHGPIERGIDASHGGVEYYNFGVDGAALATVADSFAALEQRIEHEGRLTWQALLRFLDADWGGPDGERIRLMMHSIPRFGSGSSLADMYAVRIVRAFSDLVMENPTPAGYNMIPGLFSWAHTIPMGREVGATPNGRRAGAPISHGANPDPGFRKDAAPTAMAVAIASVQPGYGNTAPMQLELDSSICSDGNGVENVVNLIKTHFDLGGTQINVNVLDVQRVLEAHGDPSKHPDLVVRVTGFSAYFASLSPEFRQLVVDRILSER
jgi:pyruvate-formate lyase